VKQLRYLVSLLIVILVIAACSGGGDDAEASSVDQNNSGDAPQVVEEAAAQNAPDDAPESVESSNGDSDAQSEPEEPALPLTASGDQIVAMVNGEPITLSQYQRAIDRSQNQITDIASYDAVAELELTRLIEQTVINQAAGGMGIAITGAEIETEYQAMRELVPDDEAWQRWLMDNRFINEAEFRQLTHDALVTQAIQSQVVNIDGMTVPQVRVRHILLATFEEASAVQARINGGEDFAVVAGEVSLDETTRAIGGDLSGNNGWITRDDLTVPELFDVALALESGQISQPVPTALGYHIVQTLEIGQRQPTPEEIAERASAQFDSWLQAQMNAAVIERYLN
jgi:peptidyl-prolyl cis-trans isomerase C